MTSGSCPMRSAAGGSLPALTIAASWGASLKALGNFAGSVTTSGPSSLPMRALLLTCASAPTASVALTAMARSAIAKRVRGVHVRSARRSSTMTLPLSFLGRPRHRCRWPGTAWASLPRPIRALCACRLSLLVLGSGGPDYRDIDLTSPDRTGVGSPWLLRPEVEEERRVVPPALLAGVSPAVFLRWARLVDAGEGKAGTNDRVDVL